MQNADEIHPESCRLRQLRVQWIQSQLANAAFNVGWFEREWFSSPNQSDAGLFGRKVTAPHGRARKHRKKSPQDNLQLGFRELKQRQPLAKQSGSASEPALASINQASQHWQGPTH